ncbi:carbamoyl-phosphate synthase small subunit [Methylohalomonas lacus]|uniref:Carbamoyl phosphate synthase small chain n=1 Tax=Methylohalomonas lacus TaxID=398773 RepID=A0AAE3L1Y9_9GAMM|nr:glutamine-hydrolyzing carbamoyl-phosphate synthase small subunit [Methylohalomonas lacus]MCS3903716.1 carbamoyl-phosphate synthase small subunit [Methylohalomonas lacus]
MNKPALLALEDGSLFRGRSIGADGQTVGEVVFNTAITGYQEILTDPSYYRQIVTLTQPHIGNVGTNAEDEESQRIYAAGLVVRDLPAELSNWRSQTSLGDYLHDNNIVAIADIDTRRLTRLLREQGAQRGCIVAGDNIDETQAVEAARAFAGLKGADLAREVSTATAYEWRRGSWQLHGDNAAEVPAEKLPWNVVAYDYGTKRNILRILTDLGCRLTVVPAQTPLNEVLAEKPDGIFLSNGPGDPEPCDYAIETIRGCIDANIPTFGICLGHQLLGLASGGRTVKMKFGHHGANHPVVDIDTGRVMITSQNHGFAVDEQTLPETMKATHRSLFDGSLQGIHHRNAPAFSFQGHPEASPGPHDVKPLFQHFIDLMQAANARK